MVFGLRREMLASLKMYSAAFTKRSGAGQELLADSEQKQCVRPKRE